MHPCRSIIHYAIRADDFVMMYCVRGSVCRCVGDVSTTKWNSLTRMAWNLAQW